MEHLELLRSTINRQTKAKLVKASSTLFGLLLHTFRLREQTKSENGDSFDNDEIVQLDNILVDSVIAMVLKLNDATFRPFFAQLVEQEGAQTGQAQRAITFYKFLAAFFDKFKVCNSLQDQCLSLTQIAVHCHKLLKLYHRACCKDARIPWER